MQFQDELEPVQHLEPKGEEDLRGVAHLWLKLQSRAFSQLSQQGQFVLFIIFRQNKESGHTRWHSVMGYLSPWHRMFTGIVLQFPKMKTLH